MRLWRRARGYPNPCKGDHTYYISGIPANLSTKIQVYFPCTLTNKKNTCVCETLCPHRQKSLKKLVLAQRSKSRSLTLVSFERASLLEYAYQIHYGSKVIAKVKVDSRQTNRQTKKKHSGQNNMPPIIWSGGIKILFSNKNLILNVEIQLFESFYCLKLPNVCNQWKWMANLKGFQHNFQKVYTN